LVLTSNTAIQQGLTFASNNISIKSSPCVTYDSSMLSFMYWYWYGNATHLL